jgi:ribosomal protein S20
VMQEHLEEEEEERQGHHNGHQKWLQKSQKKKVGRSSKIREKNKNSRKCSSLHSKIQTATRRGVIKKNLEKQQKHKGHHSRH